MATAGTRKNFLGLASFEAMAWFRRGLFYAYLSIYLRHFLGLSVTETTLFATLPMSLNILAQTFVWGRLSDRLQLRRTLIIVGELLASAGTAGLWWAHRLAGTPRTAGYVIIAGLTVIELFWSMSNVSWSALVADIYAPAQRNQIQGRLASMGGLGRMAGIWIGGLLYDGLGRQFAGWGFYEGPLFFIAAGVMVLSTAPLFFLPEGGLGAARDSGPASQPEQAPSSATLFLVFLAGMIFLNFGRNSIAIIVTQYLTLDSGLAMDSRALANIVNTQSLSMILAGWFSGAIARRWSNATALLAGGAIAVAALALLAVCTSLPWLYVSSFLRGAADVLVMSAAFALAALLIPPRQRARRLAWFNATFFLSWGLAGTLVAGPMVDLLIAAGQPQPLAYRISFGAAAAAALCGLLILAALIHFRPVLRDAA